MSKPEKSEYCSVCRHPAREHIDKLLAERIADPDVSLEDVLIRFEEEIAPNYPYGESKLSIQALGRHQKNHQLAVDPRALTVVRPETGKAIVRGEVVPIPAVKATLDEIITIGLQHLREHPDVVKPQHILDAIKIILKVDKGAAGHDELLHKLEELIKGSPAEGAGSPLYSGGLAPEETSDDEFYAEDIELSELDDDEGDGEE